MINFNLPGLYEHSDFNLFVLNFLKEQPDMVYPNINIESVYGNFQFCIFDGGRIFNRYKHTSKEEIENLVLQYNNLNTAVRLIFTNPLITKEYFNDRFANIVLDICHNGKNDIVVNSEELEDYLRNKYPNFRYISSTTKCKSKKEDFFMELNKPYDLICLDYNLNNNFNLLNSLTQEQKDKCEFLCNAICAPGCPSRKNHYELNGISYLNWGKQYHTETCHVQRNTLHPLTEQSKNYITPESIFSDYVPNGFSHFKLEGRTLSLTENVCNYAKFLIKPEYQFYFITSVLSILLENYI